ncbi:ATP-binding protein [Rhizobium leguminosarum]|uniref:ATP-dependent nuclease n=1 Tax=Rhizobium leguminosarum TaxID=384 RepID=UPI001030488C|nr:AAA family ATPase [Rhizobium leguminosarum]TAX95673.1 ATP-binding protein [Rhizobium leguminosarum]
MRLKSVFISNYKNLKDFDLAFEGDGFIDIFVGKNGSGKSNFLEALIAIFEHIYSYRPNEPGPGFAYTIVYIIDKMEHKIEWQPFAFANEDGSTGIMLINEEKPRSLSRVPKPDNIIIYYSGQNAHIAQLVERYEARFRKSIRNADLTETPRFIGIGQHYKKLLILLLLLLPEETASRRFLCDKLGILGNLSSFKLHLSRPFFATERVYDHLDPNDLFWRAQGISLRFLNELVSCIRDGATPGALHDREADEYVLEIDLRQFRRVFADRSHDQIFRLFNNLKLLGMLGDIKMTLTLSGIEVSDLGQFSDGQFQSVYIFAISELFKDKNCITLLDEPDAFLHPEWQFGFLRQTHAISETAAKSNHILMTSHSASTVAAKVASRIRMMEFNGEKIEAVEREKGELIKSLSAGLITFSEQEARLSLDFILANTTGPVLFTEGPSDVLILETAWQKLNPGKTCPVEIVQAFDRSFLRNTIMRMAHPDKNTGRIIFALFDFDEAYQDWKQLGAQVEEDIEKCLTRKKDDRDIYSLLLPVPPGLSTRNQVWNAKTGRTFEDESHLPIELLFRDVAGLEKHFEVDPKDRAGWTRFIGDKVKFAEERVPSIEAAHFEVFRPIFDFIESKTN